MDVARISPERILLFGQSLGTAVNMAVASHFASEEVPVTFAGHIVVAPFADVATLLSTYKIAGIIPILSPITRFPWLFNYLKSHIRDHWSTVDRIKSYTGTLEALGLPYRIVLVHAKDDYDIPWEHTPMLFDQAYKGAKSASADSIDVKEWREENVHDLGEAGKTVDCNTANGVISEHILNYGLHDVIMGCPIITAKVMEAFDA